MEGDILIKHVGQTRCKFQSTPSVWRETIISADLFVDCFRFQSTPSVWRETCELILSGYMVVISIHSLRVEGDLVLRDDGAKYDISIHSLRVEGDFSPRQVQQCRKTFQSTPSVWRETLPKKAIPKEIAISIHSLRVEGDILYDQKQRKISYFNPLPPCGGRQP